MGWATVIMQLLPVLINAVGWVAKDKGKPIEEVVGDVIKHLTPGAENCPALGPQAGPGNT